MRRFNSPCWLAAVILWIIAASVAVSQTASADETYRELADWLQANQESIDDLVPWPALKSSSGMVFRTPEAAYFSLTPWPSDGKLSVPRLNNPITSVYLLGKPSEALKLTPEPKSWKVDLPEQLPADVRPVVVLKTVGSPHLPLVPEQIQANAEGILVCPAHQAVTHGEMLRYEPQPHKNTVGYWVQPRDWAQWHLVVARPGRFTLSILQGCGTGQGGSTVGVYLRPAFDPAPNGAAPIDATPIDAPPIGGAAIEPVQGEPDVQFIVQDTGHFQNFVARELGTISIPVAGKYTLELRPRELKHKAVMDVREVRLVPQLGP